MRDGVAGRDARHTGGAHAAKGAGRKDRVNDDRLDRVYASAPERTSPGCKGGSTAGDVVQQDRAACSRNRGESDAHTAITEACFLAHDPRDPGGGGHCLNPGARLLVRPDEEQPAAATREKSADGGSSGKGARPPRDDFRELKHPMQVGFHREDGIEVATEERPHRTLGDRFARGEYGVLSHVGEIGRNKRDALRPRPAEGIRGENRLNQLAVRIEKGSHHHRVLARRLPYPHQALAVRETVERDPRGGQPGRSPEPVPEGRAIGEDVDASLVHRTVPEFWVRFANLHTAPT